jgi:Zn finger protein HypA/HybF involved in hydrogenase expression
MPTRKKRSVIWSMPANQFAALVKKATSIGTILQHFGLQNKGGNHNTVRRRIVADGLDISHIPLGRGSNKNRSFGPRRSLKELLVKNSDYRGRHLKKRLIQSNTIPHKCADCGLGPKWRGKKLVLQLEHKNGDSRDNRLKNLCLLCPNCHSQTSTFAGRNSGTRIRT